jgi:hypothetical protein
MTKLAIIEMIGRLFFFGAAAIGTAVATMSIALLLSLLGDKSTWLPSVGLATRGLLRVAIALLTSAVFALIWLFALYWNRAAIAEPLLFAFVFVVTAFALRHGYLKLTPAFVAKVKQYSGDRGHSQ